MLQKIIPVWIICIGYINCSAQSYGKTQFYFEFQWGIYGQYRVSSKENKVFIKIKHNDVFIDTNIVFTEKDLDIIWSKVDSIDFFSFPEFYSPSALPINDTIPEYTIYHLDSPEGVIVDTIWNIQPSYTVHEVIPYDEFYLKIFFNDMKKEVFWKGGQSLYNDLDNKRIVDPKYEDLMDIAKLIEFIVSQKEGFHNLPKSSLVYE